MCLLRRRADFRRLFVGNAVSLAGSSVTTVALPLTAVVYLRASPLHASWRFLAFGAQSVGALLGGVLGSAAGLRPTLVATSFLMLAGTAIRVASPLRSLRSLPPSDFVDHEVGRPRSPRS